MKTLDRPIILYESPHRIVKTLESLVLTMPEAQIILGKELTKMFEHIYRGKAEEVLREITKDGPRGEYTLIIKR